MLYVRSFILLTYLVQSAPMKARHLFADPVISFLSLGSIHFRESIIQLSSFQTGMKFHPLL